MTTQKKGLKLRLQTLIGFAPLLPITLPAIKGITEDDAVVKPIDMEITWFDENARRTMRNHFRYRRVQIVLAALVPVSQVFMTGLVARETAVVLGGLLFVVQGFEGLHEYDQHYVAWRATAQALLRERYLFAVGAGPYAQTPAKGEDAKQLLADRTTAITAAESQQWVSGMQKPPAQGQLPKV